MLDGPATSAIISSPISNSKAQLHISRIRRRDGRFLAATFWGVWLRSRAMSIQGCTKASGSSKPIFISWGISCRMISTSTCLCLCLARFCSSLQEGRWFLYPVMGYLFQISISRVCHIPIYFQQTLIVVRRPRRPTSRPEFWVDSIASKISKRTRRSCLPRRAHSTQ
jgi:hypothetical protein